MEGQKGFCVLINEMFGCQDGSFQDSIGKEISELSIEDTGYDIDGLIIRFKNGSAIRIRDEGQSCCENRYMVTDDDLSYFAGSKLVGCEIKDAPSIEDKYGDHDVQFLEIKTSLGVFTVSNHNEHNGYYGGFAIRCESIY